MKTYIIRRLMLMPLTLLGVTFLVFCITRFVPGGPVEQMMQQQTMSALSGQKSGNQQGDTTLSESDMEKLEEQFGLQEPLVTAYLQWLGLMPRKIEISREEFGAHPAAVKTPSSYAGTTPLHTRVMISGEGKEVIIVRQTPDSALIKDAFYADNHSHKASNEGWHVVLESPADRAQRWAKRMRATDASVIADKAGTYPWRAVMYKTRFQGLLQGTLGNSFKYNEPVWNMIEERLPISLYFGLLSAIITYSICIPLGIFKATHHKSAMDNLSSVLIFLGYSVPGFALGALLVVYLGARMEWFPLCGLTSPDFHDLSWLGQARDLAHHTVLPLICYVVSSFAVTTMMMKNNLMDNLSADYVRTAMSKGVSFKGAVFKHAFRNSFIPIATTLGNLISVIVAGSMLIEKVFDIQGFGMLSYQALMDKDYSLIMGTLLLTSFLMVLGNLLSDIIVASVDPRVKFE
ncbi:MAG: ABC transporter permease [Akkermansia sp.]